MALTVELVAGTLRLNENELLFKEFMTDFIKYFFNDFAPALPVDEPLKWIEFSKQTGMENSYDEP